MERTQLYTASHMDSHIDSHIDTNNNTTKNIPRHWENIGMIPPIIINDHPGFISGREKFLDAAYIEKSRKKDIAEIIEEEEAIKINGEFHDCNWVFWRFMFAILAVSVLFYIPLYYGNLSKDYQENYQEECQKDCQDAKSFPTPNSTILLIGFIIFYFLTGWTAYFNYKRKNGRRFRYGTLFCMIMVWILTLWWILEFAYHQKPRTAASILIFAIILLLIWIFILLFYAKYDHYLIFFLILSILWLAYIFCYTVGTQTQTRKGKSNTVYDNSYLF